ncbi:hypothetical protein SDC9_155201 [bioreactor metagenome]|uniref:Uncharacterized protein n=1 Tax=bioreactor metagenome TaxID=1076179 RepID=A0A645F0T0_9ZZZZ
MRGIFGERDIFIVRGLENDSVFCLVIKFSVAHTAVFDKRLYVVPEFFIIGSLRVKQ